MKAVFNIVIGIAIVGCGDKGASHAIMTAQFIDTTIISHKKHGAISIEEHTTYDSTGQISFETAWVSTLDTTRSVLRTQPLQGGRTFRVGSYDLWTPLQSADTFRVMIEAVRKGQFVCTNDSAPISDAYVLERRAEGYGIYSNTGFLVVPNQKDTVLLWTMADFLLPKPTVWNWDEVTPMTYDEYRQYRADLKEAYKHLATSDEIDSFVQANK